MGIWYKKGEDYDGIDILKHIKVSSLSILSFAVLFGKESAE